MSVAASQRCSYPTYYSFNLFCAAWLLVQVPLDEVKAAFNANVFGLLDMVQVCLQEDCIEHFNMCLCKL